MTFWQLDDIPAASRVNVSCYEEPLPCRFLLVRSTVIRRGAFALL
jgi:hypothetical protein